ncbi:hypothetical protein D3C76_333520 [compost metagenome]
MAHQAPLGLLDEPPLLQLLAQLALGLHQGLHHGELAAGEAQPLLHRLPLAARVGHQQHPLLQQGELGVAPQPLAEQETRQAGPEGEAEAHLGAELAATDQQGVPLLHRGQQLADVEYPGLMAVVTDQQGQAIGLARIIGVDQQAGGGAILAPGKSSHGAPCQRLSQRVCCQCRNMKANYLNLPPFYPSGGSGGRGEKPAQATRSMAWFNRACSSAPRFTTSPMIISTGLWPSRARAACSSPSSRA